MHSESLYGIFIYKASSVFSVISVPSVYSVVKFLLLQFFFEAFSNFPVEPFDVQNVFRSRVSDPI